MKSIMSVCGPAAIDDLGFCQCHEHLALSKGVSWEKNPVLLMEDEEKSLQEALRLKEHGGGTVVDAQPGGCNRMEEALQRISKASHIHIIASTGFHKLCFYPQNHWVSGKTLEELYQIFSHELSEGMYSGIDDGFHPRDTKIRAGIVKMALDKEGLTPVYRKMFLAGAHAARDAEVPMMIHIEKGSDPIALFRFLRENGFRAEHMIFCHMDRAVLDLSVHRKLLEEGVFLEYDTIGRFQYHSDERELEIFRYMIDGGYEERLLFSLDTTRARLKSYTPDGIGIDYLLTDFVPKMLAFGFTKEQIHKISHDNFIRVYEEGYCQT